MRKPTLLHAAVTLMCLAVTVEGGQQSTIMPVESQNSLVESYCVSCHNDRVKSGGFSWTELNPAHAEQNPDRAEKVIRKLRSGMMPPAGARRPEEEQLKSFAAALEKRIDEEAARQVHIESPKLHRVNATEYRNSIRDLLGIEVDVSMFLPPDARSGGFDNMSDALTVSPAVLQGFMRAADKISRLAVGDPHPPTAVTSYKVPKVVNQMRHVDGAPFGTRGGVSVVHNFPADGEYIFRVEPHYQYTGELFGTNLPEALKDQQIEISLDGKRIAIFTLDPKVKELDQKATTYLQTSPINVKAGPRRLSAAFLSQYDGPEQDLYRLAEQTMADPLAGATPGMTFLPLLQTLFVTGPFKPTGVSDTPSRRRIFTCSRNNEAEETHCATEIVSRLTKQAFRRPVTAEDLEWGMSFYESGRKELDFETGVQRALQAILSNPEFIYRFERVPANVRPGESYRINDLELASRLSFFLWSSTPDDQLINIASQGKLKDPIIFEQQVKRMLRDPRSSVLATNFAAQWLRLPSLNAQIPEPKLFRDFTRNLGQSMRREIELLFEDIMRSDRSVADLLTADYTFVDEILARHYGIPSVLGTRFQRVQLSDPTRFGLMGKAGILTMTSLANRTSPVARGKYVLEVLIGSPPPPPLPNVPPLKEAVINEKVLPVRERLEQHRNSAACRSCHQMMDPIGLALENFDAVGLWRSSDEGSPIDPTSTMYDGTNLNGPISVRQAIVKRSEAFVTSFTENLLAYALGRILDYHDMPVVRTIVRDAAVNNNRFSSFILAIAKNPAFQMNKAPGTDMDLRR